MDWCDTSSIDWNAVGAVGTWVIGAAAAVIAWRSNETAILARTAEERAREEAKSRRGDAAAAMARVAFGSFISRRNRLAILSMAAYSTADRPNRVTLRDLANVITSLDGYALPDQSHIAAYYSDLPGPVVDAIAAVYADEHQLRQGLRPIAERLSADGIEHELEDDPIEFPRFLQSIHQAADRAIAKADHAIDSLKREFGLREADDAPEDAVG